MCTAEMLGLYLNTPRQRPSMATNPAGTWFEAVTHSVILAPNVVSLEVYGAHSTERQFRCKRYSVSHDKAVSRWSGCVALRGYQQLQVLLLPTDEMVLAA